MCSIAGSFNRYQVEDMLAVMKHRAPDGEGCWRDEKIGFCLGMGRLAIIDLKSENLCPHVQDDEYAIAFNGEIYNYLELKKEMKKSGRKFLTSSDTEVLLAAYRHWGMDFLNKLNGMFAFAIYDKINKRIVFGRDIAGEKPLYFTRRPFAFASEAKALDFVCEEFPKASYGIFDLMTEELKIQPYWELKKRDIDLKTAAEELDYLLAEAVKIRTRTDVPYALYFSGGLDSSLLSTYHDFDNKLTYNDSLGYKNEFKKVFPKIVWHLDYPIQSFSSFGLWKLAEEAKQKGFKVIISGEGADELFGGYVRFLKSSLFYQCRQKFPSYEQMFKSDFQDVNEEGWSEFNGNMQELLRMGDRMAAAHGVENRCPFLDKRIIEFAFSLSPEWKIDNFDTKIILRQILAKRFPAYQDKEKQGLYCSVNAWLGEEKKYSKSTYMLAQQSAWKKILA